jgi:1-acyl-sn-glycerol-3-phosphate acyltransferase
VKENPMRRVTADFTNEQPPRRSRFLQAIGIFYFWMTGWRMTTTLPANPKMVLIAAPHTSNWDGWILIMASWIARVELNWMIKAEAVRWPLGWFIKWAGGVPIQRDASYNVVSSSAQKLKEADSMLLLVAPEGTRKKANYWKTGFYWIAHQADVPMLCARMDYGTKTVSFTGPYHPTGNIEADIEKIWDDYRDIVALHPEKFSDMRLREKDKARFK